MRYAWIEEPPFNCATAGGIGGLDVEVMRWACARLGQPLDLRRAEFADLLPGLARGDWDVTAAMFITPERTRQGWFTRPVWRLADGLLLPAALAEGITGYRSLAARGLRLAVLEGQVQHRTALDCGVAPSRIEVFASYGAAEAAVLSGAADAYASVALAHAVAVARHPELACVTVPDAERPRSPGGFACRTPEICRDLDDVLAGLAGSEAHAALLTRFGLGAAELP